MRPSVCPEIPDMSLPNFPVLTTCQIYLETCQLCVCRASDLKCFRQYRSHLFLNKDFRERFDSDSVSSVFRTI